MNKISYFWLKKDHGNPRACIRIHAYVHAYLSSAYACFIHAYAYMGMHTHVRVPKTMKYKFSISLLLIPFRPGWNISYRHANRYHNTLCSTSGQISAYFGLFRPFQPILLLFGFFPYFFFFFWWVSVPSTSLLLFFIFSSSVFWFCCELPICLSFFICVLYM